MKLLRATTLGLLLLGFERAEAQRAASAMENDSINSLSPAARYAQICPGPRDAGTGAIVGRVRDADDSTTLANATVRTQWIDVNVKNGRSTGQLSSASSKTNGSGFYLLCGVPTEMRLNLRSERGGYVANPAQLVLDERLISSVDFSIRRIDRIAGDSTSPTARGAQKLAAVAIDEKAVLPSWMERSGFEDRRKIGLGAFVTEEQIARHGFSDLASVLDGVRGVHVAFGPAPGSQTGITSPQPYLLGPGGVRCSPNYFLDGAPFAGFRDLSAIVQPNFIRGIEVYSSPGTIAVQYDRIASTGCGSIVIWTR
jgi:hypothetical protein